MSVNVSECGILILSYPIQPAEQSRAEHYISTKNEGRGG